MANLLELLSQIAVPATTAQPQRNTLPQPPQTELRHASEAERGPELMSHGDALNRGIFGETKIAEMPLSPGDVSGILRGVAKAGRGLHPLEKKVAAAFPENEDFGGGFLLGDGSTVLRDAEHLEILRGSGIDVEDVRDFLGLTGAIRVSSTPGMSPGYIGFEAAKNPSATQLRQMAALAKTHMNPPRGVFQIEVDVAGRPTSFGSIGEMMRHFSP